MFALEKIGPNLHLVIFETAEVKILVAEISRGRGWELHYRVTASALKPATYDQLTVFGQEQIALFNITERLLK